MSEQTPIITSETKTKNPKRVEAGRRLAAISKAAKEREARERFNAEQKSAEQQSAEQPSDISPTTLIAFGLITAIAGCVYYVYKNKVSNSVEPEYVPEPVEPPKTGNFISFDD